MTLEYFPSLLCFWKKLCFTLKPGNVDLPQETEEYYSCPLWCDNQFGSLSLSLEPYTNFSVAEW